ncbi:copper chaperone PCu(A)C [Streptomyces sp. NBC_01210]|uniref:copper chaperone PCu(A)C n=1 Tax=Streptomyces sp. NBC_01210 TaxID=2903774 RepID=UPI002E0D7B6C|nr:copper chaperone PCu(A)C [Streptomyces sp. NBC_01210]
MTDPDRAPAAEGWRPSRRRLRDGLYAALAPVAACAVALGGLTTWAKAGAAGSPPRIKVSDGRVFLPYGDNEDTAAFFRIANSGGAADQLVSVTSPAVESAMLSRHESADSGAGFMRMVDSAEIPAGDTVVMSPSGLDVMVRTKAPWQVGDTVPFVLHFRHGGPVDTVVVVVRPGS